MGTDAKKPAKQKSRLHMTHAQNDARYIAQGMTLFLSPNPDSAKDLARMNKGKNGRPFIYDETMMVMAGIVYPQTGMPRMRRTGHHGSGRGECPGSHHAWRRINKMDVTSVDDTVEFWHALIPDRDWPPLPAAMDTPQAQGKARLVRLSVMVDHDTMKVLAFRVTDERIGDSPQFRDFWRIPEVPWHRARAPQERAESATGRPAVRGGTSCKGRLT